jgi:hypothetical protein
MEHVMAEALSSAIDAFERFDRMVASAEARRNNALREISSSLYVRRRGATSDR